MATPFKCPPAPSETVLLMHDFLTERGLRDRSTIDLVMPLPTPIPPSPPASEYLLGAFAERGIGWHAGTLVTGLDPACKVGLLADGGELPYDLFLGVPVHAAPPVVVEAGLTVPMAGDGQGPVGADPSVPAAPAVASGWIPVDPRTLLTRFPDVYAVGDCTSVGTPKAGVFAEGQALVVADRLSALVRGEDPDAEYGGTGICYLEFGHGSVAHVQVTFLPGQAPYGDFDAPSAAIAAKKVEFGTSRVARWF
jgi:sulfide:quinone oxidoreductase